MFYILYTRPDPFDINLYIKLESFMRFYLLAKLYQTNTINNPHAYFVERELSYSFTIQRKTEQIRQILSITTKMA